VTNSAHLIGIHHVHETAAREQADWNTAYPEGAGGLGVQSALDDLLRLRCSAAQSHLRSAVW
jgi:hypothetical protein